MAFTDLSLALGEISNLFDSLVTDGVLVANLDRVPLSSELEGRSPVLSVHWDGGNYQFEGNDYTVVPLRWIASLFVNRVGHGNANTEAIMLQIVAKIAELVKNAGAGTYYEQIDLSDSNMRPSFTVIDGVSYRVVEIFLKTVTYEQ